MGIRSIRHSLSCIIYASSRATAGRSPRVSVRFFGLRAYTHPLLPSTLPPHIHTIGKRSDVLFGPLRLSVFPPGCNWKYERGKSVIINLSDRRYGARCPAPEVFLRCAVTSFIVRVRIVFLVSLSRRSRVSPYRQHALAHLVRSSGAIKAKTTRCLVSRIVLLCAYSMSQYRTCLCNRSVYKIQSPV